MSESGLLSINACSKDEHGRQLIHFEERVKKLRGPLNLFFEISDRKKSSEGYICFCLALKTMGRNNPNNSSQYLSSQDIG